MARQAVRFGMEDDGCPVAAGAQLSLPHPGFKEAVREQAADKLIGKMYDGQADELFASLLVRKKLTGGQLDPLGKLAVKREKKARGRSTAGTSGRVLGTPRLKGRGRWQATARQNSPNGLRRMGKGGYQS